MLCAVAALISIAALVYALTSFGARVNRAELRSSLALARIQAIQVARQEAALDSCRTLRALILQAGRASHTTTRAAAFAQASGLGNCRAYSIRVLKGEP